MSEGRRSHFSMQNGNGENCFYCGNPITEEEEMVVMDGEILDNYFHLHSSGQCEGWIWHNWSFIKLLLYKLTDIGGDDYDEFMDMLIKLWEEGP